MHDLNLHLYETVDNIEPEPGGGAAGARYMVTTDRGHYPTRNVCIATGFYDTPRMMNVPGEELPKVRHYYDDPHAYINQNVLVVGAANSACDAALECWRKGARVTMAIREEEIYPRVKYWIKPDIENRIAEGSIPAYFNTTVREIHPDHVILDTPEGEVRLANDFVLAMTGYQPNYALLERFGLDIDQTDACKPVYRNETLETNLPGVYMAGVVCAGLRTGKLFIENTRDHGDLIVGDILAGVPA